jgi:NTE family protein
MGYSSDEIYDLFKKYSKKIKYIQISNIYKLIYGILFKEKILITGFNSGEIIEKVIKNAAENKNIKNINEIKMPLLIPAVNVENGEIYNFISKEIRGNLSDKNININNISIGKAVRASCSYPLIFEPCRYKNIELIDGGTRENIPWKGLKKLGANRVISISFEKEITGKYCNNIVEVVSNAIDILGHELSNYELDGTDYSIKIKTKNIGLLDSKKIDELYEMGYMKIKNNINKIKEIIN